MRSALFSTAGSSRGRKTLDVELAVIVVVAVIAILASQREKRITRSLWPWAFVLAGALAGPNAVGLLQPAHVLEAEPLLALTIGLAAARWGAAWMRRRKIQWRAVPIGAGWIVFATLLLFAATFAQRGALPWALVGAAIASSGEALARRGRDPGTALCVIAMALGSGFLIGWRQGLGHVCVAILLGALTGALAAFLARAADGSVERSSIAVGSLALAVGGAAYLGVSLVVSGVCFGIVLGAFDRHAALRPFARVLAAPLWMVSMFVVGASFHFFDPFGAWLALCMLIARFGERFLVERVLSRPFWAHGPTLIPIALLADVAIREPGAPLQSWLDGALLSTFIASAISTWAQKTGAVRVRGAA